MKLEQLKNFIEVVDTGSFQKVAELNFMSQRAISISILNLENELGIKLINRGKNKISITPAGQQFYVNVRDILHSLDTTIDVIKSRQDNTKFKLNVGYSAPFEGGLLARQINSCIQQNPKIKFNVFEKSVENLIYDIVLGTLDCAYIIDYKDSSPYLQDKQFATNTIFSNQIKIGVSRLNTISKKETISVKELKKLPLLYCVPEESNYIMYGLLKAIKIDPELIKIRRAPSIEQMQIKVATNQAFAHYCGGLIDLPLKDQIKYLPIENVDASYQIKLVYLKNSNKLPLIQHFLKLLNL